MHTDTMYSEITKELETLVAQGVSRELHPALRVHAGKVEFRGRSLIDFSNWDFLNLTRHESVIRAAHEALENEGHGSHASRASSGSFPSHLSLEKRLAKFFSCESALVFSSRNQAVFSLITSLCNERDLVLMEEDLSLPCADAAYLVNASFAAFPSRNLSSLTSELEKHRSSRRKVIFVESVRSSNGDVLDWPALCAVAARFNAFVVVDESAAITAIGMRGAGLLGSPQPMQHSLLLGKINELAPLSGSQLGCFGGPSAVVTLVAQRSRTFGVEISPPPTAAAGIVAAVDAAELMDSARARLIIQAQRLRSGVARVFKSKEEIVHSHIVGIQFESLKTCLNLSAALFSRGVLADVVQGKSPLSHRSTLRFITNAAHSDEMIDHTLEALHDVVPRL